MIGNILDNMIKYAFGEIFSSGGATFCKNPSDQTVYYEVYSKITLIPCQNYDIFKISFANEIIPYFMFR